MLASIKIIGAKYVNGIRSNCKIVFGLNQANEQYGNVRINIAANTTQINSGDCKILAARAPYHEIEKRRP